MTCGLHSRWRPGFLMSARMVNLPILLWSRRRSKVSFRTSIFGQSVSAITLSLAASRAGRRMAPSARSPCLRTRPAIARWRGWPTPGNRRAWHPVPAADRRPGAATSQRSHAVLQRIAHLRRPIMKPCKIAVKSALRASLRDPFGPPDRDSCHGFIGAYRMDGHVRTLVWSTTSHLLASVNSWNGHTCTRVFTYVSRRRSEPEPSALVLGYKVFLSRPTISKSVGLSIWHIRGRYLYPPPYQRKHGRNSKYGEHSRPCMVQCQDK